MSESLRLARTGLNTALAYTLPLLAWLVGQGLLFATGRADPVLSLHMLLSTLLLVQACAVTFCLPWLLRHPSLSGQISAVCLVVLVPLPLYAIVWLAGAVPAMSLFLALICLFALAALLRGWFTVCLALTGPGQLRSLLLLGTQLVALACYWNYRADWQSILNL